MKDLVLRALLIVASVISGAGDTSAQQTCDEVFQARRDFYAEKKVREQS